MVYKELPFIGKTYIVQHTVGFGVVESPREHLEYVDAFDTKDEALKYGEEKYPRDPSGWIYDGFDIVINTSTEKGKEEYEKFSKRFDSSLKKIAENPQNYYTYKINGQTISLEHNNLLDNE